MKNSDMNFKKTLIIGLGFLFATLSILIVININSNNSEKIFYKKLYEYVAFNEIAYWESDNYLPKCNVQSGTIQRMLDDYTKYLNGFNDVDYNIIKKIENLMINEQEFLKDFDKYEKKYPDIIQEWSSFFELSHRSLKAYESLYKDGLEMKELNNQIINSGNASLTAYRPVIDRMYSHIELYKKIQENANSYLALVNNLYAKYDYPDSFDDPNSNFDDYLEQKLRYKKSFDIQKLYDELKIN